MKKENKNIKIEYPIFSGKSFQKKLKISLTYYVKDDTIYTVMIDCM